MSHTICEEVRSSAPEYALGLLPLDERVELAGHLASCAECRREVTDMVELAEDLAELIPSAEPPLGFDRQVLAAVEAADPPSKVRTRRPVRTRWAVAAAAVAAATVAFIAGVAADSGDSGHHDMNAALVSSGHVIGSAYTEGRPLWVWMNVQSASVSGPVTCELIEKDGQLVAVGTFDLVKGSGSWAAPVPAGATSITGALLVSAGGGIVGSATFRT